MRISQAICSTAWGRSPRSRPNLRRQEATYQPIKDVSPHGSSRNWLAGVGIARETNTAVTEPAQWGATCT